MQTLREIIEFLERLRDEKKLKDCPTSHIGDYGQCIYDCEDNYETLEYAINCLSELDDLVVKQLAKFFDE